MYTHCNYVYNVGRAFGVHQSSHLIMQHTLHLCIQWNTFQSRFNLFQGIIMIYPIYSSSCWTGLWSAPEQSPGNQIIYRRTYFARFTLYKLNKYNVAHKYIMQHTLQFCMTGLWNAPKQSPDNVYSNILCILMYTIMYTHCNYAYNRIHLTGLWSAPECPLIIEFCFLLLDVCLFLLLDVCLFFIVGRAFGVHQSSHLMMQHMILKTLSFFSHLVH